MDLGAVAVERLTLPSCVFIIPESVIECADDSPEDRADIYLAVQESKERIESLVIRQDPPWRVDGSANYGTQFFTVPPFAIGNPPLRIDTFIPDPCEYPSGLRIALRSSAAVLLKNRHVAGLPISHHIRRALEAWSRKQPDFEDTFNGMPFGSRIIVENFAPEISDMRIHLIPNYDLEREMLSIEALTLVWCLDHELDHPGFIIPPVIDFTSLQLDSQLHDSIALVRIDGEAHGSRLFVFKSATSDIKYLYHELKLLLSIRPHPNVISRPSYVVVKRCRFGGKHGVCGFILPYYRLGSLASNLSEGIPSNRNGITSQDQLRFAGEITSALLHVKDSPARFYSDLRPENIVLSLDEAGKKHAVLIDFENRGNWLSWSPPEIYYARYLEHLAEPSSTVAPASITAKYQRLAQTLLLLPPPAHGNRYYKNPRLGYSTPWLSLIRPEQEAAQVFMLGKLLWCIFEAVPSIHNNCVIDIPCADAGTQHSFPTFRHTPLGLRDIIVRCTAGAPEWRARYPPVTIIGDKLYCRGATRLGGGGIGRAKETLDAAMAWWTEEIADMERFLESWAARRRVGDVGGKGDGENAADDLDLSPGRPSLKEVLAVIREMDGGSGLAMVL